MTGTEIALIIGNAASLVTAIGGLFVVLRKVEVIHKATNGMHQELNALTAKSSKAEGVKQEKEDEATRKAASR